MVGHELREFAKTVSIAIEDQDVDSSVTQPREPSIITAFMTKE